MATMPPGSLFAACDRHASGITHMMSPMAMPPGSSATMSQSPLKNPGAKAAAMMAPPTAMKNPLVTGGTRGAMRPFR